MFTSSESFESTSVSKVLSGGTRAVSPMENSGGSSPMLNEVALSPLSSGAGRVLSMTKLSLSAVSTVRVGSEAS